MARKVIEQVPEEQLQEDLEKYRCRAIELGATDTRVIPADSLIIDERVRAKCEYPKCKRYGMNANCPPHTMEPEQIRQLVGKFRYALLIRLQVSPKQMAGTEFKEKDLDRPFFAKMQEIVSRIEAEAFYDGYYLAVGFASGSCQYVLCPDMECQALIPGKGCRHPEKARASMEAVGMDVFALATKAGWEIYPIGRATSPDDIPFGALHGLVLII